MKISKKWRRMQEVYRWFADGLFDLSEEAAERMYLYESTGTGDEALTLFNGTPNGYAVAKHWMDATVKMWKQDLQDGLLTKRELYEMCPTEIHWWLDKVV